jgi:hypothetical protein
MTSKKVRNTEFFLRNKYKSVGMYEFPSVRKDDLDVSSISLISYSDTCLKDSLPNRQKGVHFFIDDYRFESVYYYPEQSLKKLSQYSFLISPDFSLYAEMPRAIQIYNVFKNRWVAAYWQNKGLKVIPCISWSDSLSYQYCFDSIEENSIVAIGMIGCKSGNKLSFLRGYNALIERINPSSIIVFGVPFPEMKGNLINIDYLQSRRINRNGR